MQFAPIKISGLVEEVPKYLFRLNRNTNLVDNAIPPDLSMS